MDACGTKVGESTHGLSERQLPTLCLVVFRMVVFRPFASEVILAKVKSSDEDGIRRTSCTELYAWLSLCRGFSNCGLFRRHIRTLGIPTGAYSLVSHLCAYLYWQR